MRDSPCVAICTTLYEDVCRGCGRTATEVSEWVTYDNAKRQLIMQQLCEKQVAVTHTNLSWSVVTDVYNKYLEPTRFYHTWDHIKTGFELLISNNATKNQCIAWLLHDVVYKPGSSTNELDSADYAKSLGLSEEVYTIILDTKYHFPTTEASKLVLDVDLSSLAARPDVFTNNTKLLRQEFRHLTDEQFEVSRHQFFVSLLDRDRIFNVLTHLEQLARINIRNALNV